VSNLEVFLNWLSAHMDGRHNQSDFDRMVAGAQAIGGALALALLLLGLAALVAACRRGSTRHHKYVYYREDGEPLYEGWSHAPVAGRRAADTPEWQPATTTPTREATP
jgi:hypothetical protein